MGDLILLVIVVALLWIGWELTRIADFIQGFVANYKIKDN
jgi:hypothetical protein